MNEEPPWTAATTCWCAATRPHSSSPSHALSPIQTSPCTSRSKQGCARKLVPRVLDCHKNKFGLSRAVQKLGAAKGHHCRPRESLDPQGPTMHSVSTIPLVKTWYQEQCPPEVPRQGPCPPPLCCLGLRLGPIRACCCLCFVGESKRTEGKERGERVKQKEKKKKESRDGHPSPPLCKRPRTSPTCGP